MKQEEKENNLIKKNLLEWMEPNKFYFWSEIKKEFDYLPQKRLFKDICEPLQELGLIKFELYKKYPSVVHLNLNGIKWKRHNGVEHLTRAIKILANERKYYTHPVIDFHLGLMQDAILSILGIMPTTITVPNLKEKKVIKYEQ